MGRLRFRLRSLLIATIVAGLVLAAVANLVRPGRTPADLIVGVAVLIGLLLVAPTFLAARIALRDPTGANRRPLTSTARPVPRLGERPLPRPPATQRRRATIGQHMLGVAVVAAAATLGLGLGWNGLIFMYLILLWSLRGDLAVLASRLARRRPARDASSRQRPRTPPPPGR